MYCRYILRVEAKNEPVPLSDHKYSLRKTASEAVPCICGHAHTH